MIDGKCSIITIQLENAVLRLKEMIQQNFGYPIAEQRLVFKGKNLENLRKLCEYNIEEYSTIHFCLKLLGGLKFYLYYHSKEQKDTQRTTLNYNESGLISDLKKKISLKYLTPLNNILIYCQIKDRIVVLPENQSLKTLKDVILFLEPSIFFLFIFLK